MFKKFLLFTLIGILLVSTHCARERTSEDIIANVIQTLDSLETYSAVLNVRIAHSTMLARAKAEGVPEPEDLLPDWIGTTQIWGKVPDCLLVKGEMRMPKSSQDSDSMQVKMVFDGEYQWIEASMLGGDEMFAPRTAARIRLKDVTTPEKPFDTFYYLQGFGLMQGEDLPHSIKSLMKLYDFKKAPGTQIDGIDCEVLEGQKNQVVFRKLNKEFYPGSIPGAELIEDLGMNFARFYFDQDDHFIRKYELGSDLNQPIFSVVFRQIELDPELPEDIFVYQTPVGIEVEDITEVVIKRRELYKEMMQKVEKVTTEIIPTPDQWGIRLIYYNDDRPGKHQAQRMMVWLVERGVTNVFTLQECIRDKNRICVYAGPYDSEQDAQEDLSVLKAKRQSLNSCELVKFE